MRGINDIPKGPLQDALFLHVSNTILAESYVPMFRNRGDNSSIKKLCDDNVIRSTDLIRQSIEEYGKFSPEHRATFDISQFCTKFMEILMSVEGFRATSTNYIPSFRRISMPKRPMFIAFRQLDPGFPAIDVPPFELSKDIILDIYKKIIYYFITYYAERKMTQQSLAFHYTSCEALLGIIQSNSIWLTEIEKLNDMDEFTKSANELLPHIETNFQHFPREKFVGCVLDYISSAHTEDFSKDVFVFSMTKNGESSSQWLSYAGNGGGVCIGFDLDLCMNPRFNSFIFDIKYNPSAKSLDKLFIDYIIFESLHASQIALNDDEYENAFPPIQNYLSILWSLILSSYKNSSFSSESEVRMCSICPSSDLVKSRNGPYGLTRYIEQSYSTASGINFLPICEVKFGNKVSPERQNQIIGTLKERGYGHVKFSTSTTLLR